MSRAPRASFAPALWVLGGLALGLALGLGAVKSGSPTLLAAARGVEPLGILFVNAIRMTVVPLVVALLVTGIVSLSDAGAVTRLGLRTLALGVGLTAAVALFALAIAGPLFGRMRLDPAVAGLVGVPAADTPPPAPPGLVQWFSELIPVNPLKAAAD
ncbi:MAG TPA: cation:dicarboxylase symporter family transporter, partial [Gemmatimonadales bacterium]|nr:cation:dicarboxylase symporter family transporter [Gemmatimonadales bacterium]